MSHDDRIRQLTNIFIEDLRGPIEASLHQLLAQMMTFATREQGAAIDQAVAEAAAQHKAALDAALKAATRQREEAIEALRAEVTERHGQALEAAAQAAHEEREQALAALRADLAAEQDGVIDTLRAEFAQRQDEALASAEQEAAAVHDDRLQALREALSAQHEAALAALREQTAAERDAAVQAAREELGREHDAALAALREELEREHEAAVMQFREATAREHEAALEGQRDQAAGERETAMVYARQAAEAIVAETLAAVRQERDAARATVAELTDQLAAARAQHEQLAQLAHAESAAAEQMLAGSVAAHAEERQSELACTERLLNAIRRLDEARTLTDVLTVLAEHVASESLRTAVLLVHGNRLRGWRFAGMGDVEANSVDLPLDGAGILGRAVHTAAAVSSDAAVDAPGGALPAFLVPPSDRVGLALPILVGGRAVAVVYSDDAVEEARMVPSNWPETAEVVARHAGRCLEALTLARGNGFAHRPPQETRPATSRPATPPPAPASETDEAQEEESARRHARLLISEIKLYNETLVEQGRREGNLLVLLGSEIERARRLYEEKIPAAVRERVNCFDEELVRTLAGGDRALLGQIT